MCSVPIVCPKMSWRNAYSISGPILCEKANYFYTKLHPGERQIFFFGMNIKKKLNQQHFSNKKYIHWPLESEVQIWNKQQWQLSFVKKMTWY